jgi:PEP-CTERM motif
MLRIIAAAFIFVFAVPAYAGVIFNSLDSPNTSTANDNSEPMFATLSTGAASILGDVSLLLSSPYPTEPDDTFFVQIGGGRPLSSFDYDPSYGLVGNIGNPIESVTLSMSMLSSSLTVEQFDQFAGLALAPNSLYWIEVEGNTDAELDWGITSDTSGVGVATNYLSWAATDGFFLNKGIEPFPFDNALQMKVDVSSVPEPSTWLMMAIGFVGLVGVGIRKTPASGRA